MTVAFRNFNYRYSHRGKPIFAPSKIGRRIGVEVKKAVEAAHHFDQVYFHLRAGGHVAALHSHRPHRYFACIDINRFFYSISSRRVQSAIDRAGVPNASFYAKWSTVANPYNGPKFVLPYGFVQSPVLATLVVATSRLGDHFRKLPDSVAVSIYMDDICLSCNSMSDLQSAYDETLIMLAADKFSWNLEKLRPPAEAIDIFNCNLTQGHVSVQDARIAKFFTANSSQIAEEAFSSYCATVAKGNS